MERVVYLDSDFNPVDESEATLCKVIYDDGRVVFGTRPDVEKYNPNQPRAPKGSPDGGQWMGPGVTGVAGDRDGDSDVDGWDQLGGQRMGTPEAQAQILERLAAGVRNEGVKVQVTDQGQLRVDPQYVQRLFAQAAARPQAPELSYGPYSHIEGDLMGPSMLETLDDDLAFEGYFKRAVADFAKLMGLDADEVFAKLDLPWMPSNEEQILWALQRLYSQLKLPIPVTPVKKTIVRRRLKKE